MAETNGSAQGDYPQLNPYSSPEGAAKAEDTKKTVVGSAQQAMDTVSNHPITQNVKNTIAQQPLAQSASNQASKAGNELNALAASRQTPQTSAATGQPLTHYHSFFYSLFSWENPRATAIAFAATVSFILAARYLNLLKYVLKSMYIVLGITASAEVAGRVIFGSGFASSMRPRKYYTIPREALESTLEDIEQLINFFVIEFQRILFAENVFATLTVAGSALIGYGLMKITPLWGLALLATVVAYSCPLVYISNREFIDEHMNHAGELVHAQASQVRDMAAQHTGKASETMSAYTKQYTQQASSYLHGNKAGEHPNGTSAPGVNQSSFPTAPSHEPAPAASTEAEPVASTGAAEPVAAQ